MASQKSRIQELEEFRKAYKSDHPYVQPSCCGSSQICGVKSVIHDSELSDESEVEDYQHGSDDDVDFRYLFIRFGFVYLMIKMK